MDGIVGCNQTGLVSFVAVSQQFEANKNGEIYSRHSKYVELLTA